MRILIDIGHPAHVHYFRNFVKLMDKRGHEFFISARDKEVSLTLLEKYNIPYYNRGKGYSSIIGKTGYLGKVAGKLYGKAVKFKPDLFVSFASPYAAIVSRALHKPHIAFTDTENARLGILSFAPFSECINTPKSFQKDFRSKHVRFNGFMELCYLHPAYYTPNRHIMNDLGLSENEAFAVMRFVSWAANHDLGQSGIPDQYKLELVKELKKSMRVYISSEGKILAELEKYKLQISPDKMHDLLSSSNIYIGEGATMASECAMLGTPAVYVNSLTSGTINEQEKYGLLYSYRNFDGVLNKVKELLSNPNLKQETIKKRNIMLSEQVDVTAYMVWFVENYPQSFRIMKENPEYQERFRS